MPGHFECGRSNIFAVVALTNSILRMVLDTNGMLYCRLLGSTVISVLRRKGVHIHCHRMRLVLSKGFDPVCQSHRQLRRHSVEFVPNTFPTSLAGAALLFPLWL